MTGVTVLKIQAGTDFGNWYWFSVRDLMVRYMERIFGTDFSEIFELTKRLIKLRTGPYGDILKAIIKKSFINF